MYNEKKTIHAFDFDGTLTTKDSFIEFIRYAKGTCSLLIGLGLFSPLLFLMKLKVINNWRVKQWLFSWYFKGMSEDEFNKTCQKFATDCQWILRPLGIEHIDSSITLGQKVIIVSASIENWIKPFFEGKDVSVVSTQLETREGKLTGVFKTRNCYGAEKVNRINSICPPRREYVLIAYGDSRGDKEMLEYSDIAHYKPFRTK